MDQNYDRAGGETSVGIRGAWGFESWNLIGLAREHKMAGKPRLLNLSNSYSRIHPNERFESDHDFAGKSRNKPENSNEFPR
jgi:hypothetical protein